MAEGVSGYLNFGYSNLDSRSEDASGNVSRTEANSFNQRYNLTFSRTLYPYLRFSASGLFDKTDSESTTNGMETESTLTRIQPYADLTLRTPIYTAGVRYLRREETASSSSGPSITNINETSTAILGWRPEDFPHIEMRAERTHLFDKERAYQDMVRDFIGLTAEYVPSDNLAIRYRPSYINTKNQLTSLETKQLNQVGRVDYSDRIAQERISFNTSYNVVHSTMKTSVTGAGLVDIGLVPFSGLSSIDDTPADGALTPNASLIDGALAASTGVNIGLPPITGDGRERNLGLDLSLPGEMNTLFVWVDRELPAAIASSFSWDIYTSSDNLVWNFHTTVFPAQFGPFDNRFEIAFSPVTTRYIKVVVKPLSPVVTGATGFPDIFVTELQAFARKPAEEVRGETTSTIHAYNFDGRAQLLDIPNLNYELSYFYTKTEPSSQERWNLSNGLLVSQRFSKVFSGSARVAREDFSDPAGNGVAYVTNASLMAVPLRTLRHSLTYSGRDEERDGGRTDTKSLFLNNYADLYKGINIVVSGGESFQNRETGENVKSTIWSVLSNLMPHPDLNLSYFFSSTKTDRSGGGGPGSSDFTRRTEVSASYIPFRTLYLVATLSKITDQERDRTFHNYSLNWSPFPDGAFQFSLAYNESLASENNAMTRVITPSVRLNLSRTSYLAASYQVSHGESDLDKSDARAFSTSLMVFF